MEWRVLSGAAVCASVEERLGLVDCRPGMNVRYPRDRAPIRTFAYRPVLGIKNGKADEVDGSRSRHLSAKMGLLSCNPRRSHRGSGDSMYARKVHATWEAPSLPSDRQPDGREGWEGRDGVAERPVVPRKSGNAVGGKEPQFKMNATSGEGQEIGKPINSEKRPETAEGVARESEGRSWLGLVLVLCRLPESLRLKETGEMI